MDKELKKATNEMRDRAVKAAKSTEALESLRNSELVLSVIDKADRILERLSNAS